MQCFTPQNNIRCLKRVLYKFTNYFMSLLDIQSDLGDRNGLLNVDFFISKRNREHEVASHVNYVDYTEFK